MPYGYEDSTGKMNTYDNTEDNYDGNMNQYADLMLTRIVQVVKRKHSKSKHLSRFSSW